MMIRINTHQGDAVHSVPPSCLCCSPSSSALIPTLLSSSNTTAFSACRTIPGGAIIAGRGSTLSCCSLGWSRPWAAGPSAAPTPGPAPPPTSASGASSCFWVIAGFFKAAHEGKDHTFSGIYTIFCCFLSLSQCFVDFQKAAFHLEYYISSLIHI